MTHPEQQVSSQENDSYSSVTDPSVSRFWKHFFICCVVSCFGILGYFWYAEQKFNQLTPSSKISKLWMRDLDLLRSKSLLPKQLEDIKSYNIVAGSPLAKEWSTELTLPFSVNKSGVHHLEILILAIQDPGTEVAIVQMNITKVQNNQHVWEMARSYNLSASFYDQPVLKEAKEYLLKLENLLPL